MHKDHPGLLSAAGPARVWISWSDPLPTPAGAADYSSTDLMCEEVGDPVGQRAARGVAQHGARDAADDRAGADEVAARAAARAAGVDTGPEAGGTAGGRADRAVVRDAPVQGAARRTGSRR